MDALTPYKKYCAAKRGTLAALGVLTLLSALLCLSAGYAGLGPVTLLKALFRQGDATDVLILWNIRMPRLLAALTAGVGLALAGCVMQSTLNNPMASPATLGISNAAVLGANFAIVMLGAGGLHSTHGEAISITHPYLVALCAFVCAVGVTMLILLLSSRGGFSPETIVLSGVAMNAFCGAGTTLIQFFAVDTQLAAAVFWTFGDLGRASYHEVGIMLAVVALAAVYFFGHRWSYNALAAGEEEARGLGIRTGRVRVVSLLLAALVCAVCVSFLGIIGFVGLVAPQMMRRLLGPDHRFLLPASALSGASLLLLSDALARSLMSGISLPVGAITSLFGGPAFLWMLMSRREKIYHKKRGGR